jgi:hypothetical protein
MLALVDTQLFHWFLIPVTICGVLIGVDAVDWARRRDKFDPQALLGLVGFHLFYLAPVLHVMLDHWARYVVPPADWRHALGVMAIVNTAGLAVYRFVVSFRRRQMTLSPSRQLDEGRFHLFGVIALGTGLSAFIAELIMFGGLEGFLATMTANRGDLAGLGWLLVVSESFPLLVFAVIAVRWRAELAERRVMVFVLLFGLAMVQFFVGGLRGSRSNTVWPVLFGLMIVHYLIFRISRKTLLICALTCGMFMYVYGIYKSAGVEVLDVARGARSAEEIISKTGRDLPTMLLGDLSRADVQALVLDRQQSGYGELGYGVTYAAAPAFLAPRWLLPERPPGKVGVGTNMLYGAGVYESGIRSSRVYGLAGEAILNFGPVGAVFQFGILGLIVPYARRYCARARDGSDLAPKLLAPMVCAVTVLLLTSDLDNIVWFIVKEVVPLTLVVLLALTRKPVRMPASGPEHPAL